MCVRGVPAVRAYVSAARSRLLCMAEAGGSDAHVVVLVTRHVFWPFVMTCRTGGLLPRASNPWWVRLFGFATVAWPIPEGFRRRKVVFRE
jgi:hypothetical protein